MVRSAIKNKDTHGFIWEIKRHKFLYLMLLPGILFYIIFHYVPMYGAIIAFKDYSPVLGIIGSEWVGFKHFERTETLALLDKVVSDYGLQCDGIIYHWADILLPVMTSKQLVDEHLIFEDNNAVV